MLNIIDSYLNNITMYRLVLYYLCALTGIAFLLTFFHLLPFSPGALLFATAVITIMCYVVNTVFAKLFHAQTNLESVYISALILVCILTPPALTFSGVMFLFWASVFTIASKFLVTIHRKHFFNPVAFGVWFTALGLAHYASWWIGTGVMLPAVLIGGFLIARKIRREEMVFTLFLIAIMTIGAFSDFSGGNLIITLRKILLETPLFFFGFVMFTEPLTTPPTKRLRLLYAALVGFLFAPQLSFFGIRTTPESALLIGNIFSYLVSPKTKLFLYLKEKVQKSSDIFDFFFVTEKPFSFTPGQYMEWTLSHPHTDSRGNRRYFTLASSPTEKEIILGVRIVPNGSSYKKALENLQKDEEVIASQIAGDFTLPDDSSKRLVFLAGGIGITPFRSIIKYLLDKNEKRNIVLLYAAKTPSDFVYQDVFDQAQKTLGIKVVYTVTDKEKQYPNWKGNTGRVDAEMIQKEVPDFTKRFFYLSGPQAMVKGYEEVLKQLGISQKQIIKDYFPGFA